MTVPTLGPVTKLLHAANSHPTGDFLAIFAHDGVVDDWGREYIGRGAIKEWSDREFIGAKVSLSVIRRPRSPITNSKSAPRSGATATPDRARPRHPALKVRQGRTQFREGLQAARANQQASAGHRPPDGQPHSEGSVLVAAGSALASGWSTCCLSWWRDFTPSLRNALRR
jgi:hypothetical protein